MSAISFICDYKETKRNRKLLAGLVFLILWIFVVTIYSLYFELDVFSSETEIDASKDSIDETVPNTIVSIINAEKIDEKLHII